MQDHNVNEQSNTDEGIDYQDIALAFLTRGIEGVRSLYLDDAIPPAMSMEAWGLLHQKCATKQELAIFLVHVHAPVSIKAEA